MEISTPPEIAVGTHFHTQNGTTKTTLVVLPAEEEASWSLFPSFISLLSGVTGQQERAITVLYQGNRSGLRKPKKDKHQYLLQLPPAFTSLSQSHLI